MQNVGIGDVLFIILILGVVHGIMHLITTSRKKRARSSEEKD